MEFDKVIEGQYYRIKKDAQSINYGELHPFCGVLVLVVKKMGMQMSGFDTFVQLIGTHRELATKCDYSELELYHAKNDPILRPVDYQQLPDQDAYYIEIDSANLELDPFYSNMFAFMPSYDKRGYIKCQHGFETALEEYESNGGQYDAFLPWISVQAINPAFSVKELEIAKQWIHDIVDEVFDANVYEFGEFHSVEIYE